MPFSDPAQIIGRLALSEGVYVADFGAGVGAYSIPCAHRVGNSGKVYAIDIQGDVLTTLKNEAKDTGLLNIETIVGDLEDSRGSKLPDTSVDVVIIANILFQIEHKDTFIQEAHRVLKPGGRLLLVSWSESFGHLGPHPEHVVTKEMAEKMFIERGFSVGESDIPAGEHHYGMIFTKDD